MDKSMIYCIKVERSGIGEENCVLHESFEKEPTMEEIVEFVKKEDIGYEEDYCKIDYYRIG